MPYPYRPCLNSENGDPLFKCIEEIAYKTEKIIGEHECNTDLKTRTFFTMVQNGLISSFHDEKGEFEYATLALNGKLAYNVYFTDPMLQFISSHPRIIPRSLLTLKPKEGTVQVLLKVSKQ